MSRRAVEKAKTILVHPRIASGRQPHHFVSGTATKPARVHPSGKCAKFTTSKKKIMAVKKLLRKQGTGTKYRTNTTTSREYRQAKKAPCMKHAPILPSCSPPLVHEIRPVHFYLGRHVRCRGGTWGRRNHSSRRPVSQAKVRKKISEHYRPNASSRQESRTEGGGQCVRPHKCSLQTIEGSTHRTGASKLRYTSSQQNRCAPRTGGCGS